MIAHALIQELQQESEATRRVLERVPNDKLGWKPHAKSMTLGQLALHVADTPGKVAQMVAQPAVSIPGFEQPHANSSAQLLEALDSSLAEAADIVGGIDDAAMQASWKVLHDGKEVMVMPRMAALRTIMLNHLYHHRGQLMVYLRLLDVPLPSVYGPTADEAPPFMA